VELSDSREPFEVDAGSLSALVTAFRSRGVDLVIDYEHQSLQGERAPAAGWIKDLEARSDGLWARVEWTRQARDYLLSKEYRYFSPVLRLDPETRRPLALLHLGLTNVPAIKRLAPLVAKYGGGAEEPTARQPEQEKEEAMEKIKAWLGLAPEAEAEEVAGRVLEVLGEVAAALNLPAEASWPEIQEALASLKAQETSLREGRAELAALKDRWAAEAAERAVGQAVQSGKISPAQKVWALEYCRRDPEGFSTYVARAPKAVPVGELLALRSGEGPAAAELLPEEAALCRSLHLAPEQYLAAKGRTA